MEAAETFRRILESGVVAVVRSETSTELIEVVRALSEGGITASEITLTVPGALEVIREARREFGESVVLGAGSVLDPESARLAILAGAEFVVSPVVNLEMIRLVKRYGQVVAAGAFTPTEVLAAWEAGADIVKIFPADVGGPAYLKAIHGPLPQVRLMPTGGVDLGNAEAFLRVGACCLGVGSSLVDPKAIRERRFDDLKTLAGRFRELVDRVRREG